MAYRFGRENNRWSTWLRLACSPFQIKFVDLANTGLFVALRNIMPRFLRATLFVGAAWVVVGCASSSIVKDDGAVSLSPAVMPAEYRIGVDDRVQVSVWRNPDLSVVVPVRPDGRISVPLIGDVPAGDKTASELANIIKGKLSTYIRDPFVTVIITELRSHEFLSRVRVTGAVRTPRTMPYRPGMTVLDVVLEAGGINDFAAPNRTKLYRTSEGKARVFDIDLGDIIKKGRLETNVKLVPGDVITVPERFF